MEHAAWEMLVIDAEINFSMRIDRFDTRHCDIIFSFWFNCLLQADSSIPYMICSFHIA